jgi:RNA polymerase sigma factor (sigma-70 family)
MIDDATLLRRYAVEKSGEAFAELVRRHLPLVYSAAVRRLGGDTHHAEDVAQEVFCALARNAHRLVQHPTLSGWLYTATRNEVTNIVRGESRRRVREKEAQLMEETTFATEAPSDWSQLRPVLDTAMDQLGERDREAVLLRFFQGLPFADIGAVIGLSEEAARKRVDRALDTLRSALGRHGIASTSAALATLLVSGTISAAPASLAASVTGAALASGAAAAAAVGVFTFTKLQVGIATVAIAGGAIGLVTQQRALSSLREGAAATEQREARLAADNATLTRAQTDANAEIARLRAELATLQKTAGSVTPAPPMKSAAASRSAATAPARATTKAQADYDKHRAELHHRHDAFLQRYGLSPAQIERFVDLKIAIAEAQSDLQAAMRQTGAAGGSASAEAVRAKLVNPMWAEIHQLLGPEGSRAYRDHERDSALLEAYVEPLLPSFAAANVPLSPQQADALVAILVANSRSVRANRTDLGTTGVMDWDAVIKQAAAVLTPEQLRVFEARVSRSKKSATR